MIEKGNEKDMTLPLYERLPIVDSFKGPSSLVKCVGESHDDQLTRYYALR